MTTSHEDLIHSPTDARIGPTEDGVTTAQASPAGADNDLARRSTTGFEVFGQSLAATGPSIAIAGTVAVVFLTAGQGTIWSYVLATFVVVLVGYSIAVFARRTAAAGSLLHLHRVGSGSWHRLCWWLGPHLRLRRDRCRLPRRHRALLRRVLGPRLGLNGESRAWQIPLIVIFAVLTLVLPIRGVRVSTHVAVILEIISLVAIAILIAALFVHYGAHIDKSQFRATGSTGTGIALGTVFAVGASWDSRARPRSGSRPATHTGRSPVPCCSPCWRRGSSTSSPPTVRSSASLRRKLAAESAPLNGLATTAGVGWLAYILDLAVAISAAACVSASLNAAARGLYSLGARGDPPEGLRALALQVQDAARRSVRAGTAGGDRSHRARGERHGAAQHLRLHRHTGDLRLPLGLRAGRHRRPGVPGPARGADTAPRRGEHPGHGGHRLRDLQEPGSGSGQSLQHVPLHLPGLDRDRARLVPDPEVQGSPSAPPSSARSRSRRQQTSRATSPPKSVARETGGGNHTVVRTPVTARHRSRLSPPEPGAVRRGAREPGADRGRGSLGRSPRSQSRQATPGRRVRREGRTRRLRLLRCHAQLGRGGRGPRGRPADRLADGLPRPLRHPRFRHAANDPLAPGRRTGPLRCRVPRWGADPHGTAHRPPPGHRAPGRARLRGADRRRDRVLPARRDGTPARWSRALLLPREGQRARARPLPGDGRARRVRTRGGRHLRVRTGAARDQPPPRRPDRRSR